MFARTSGSLPEVGANAASLLSIIGVRGPVRMTKGNLGRMCEPSTRDKPIQDRASILRSRFATPAGH
jgi:hypothetical protein